MKVMTKTKLMFREWLLKQYAKEQIVFNKYGSPDFLLPEGRKIEVKRPMGNVIYFTDRQWRMMDDKTEVAIVHEDYSEPLAIIPFREIRKAYEQGMNINIGERSFRVNVSAQSTGMIVKDKETICMIEELVESLGITKGEAIKLALRHYLNYLKDDDEIACRLTKEKETGT